MRNNPDDMPGMVISVSGTVVFPSGVALAPLGKHGINTYPDTYPFFSHRR
jgi:hypothetical protein